MHVPHMSLHVWYVNTHGDCCYPSAPQLVLSDTAASGRCEDANPESCSVVVVVAVMVVGGPRLPFPLISLLPSSHQHAPHERSHASQQHATSHDTQHAIMGSVCQEICLLSSLNFIEAHASYITGGKGLAPSSQLFTALDILLPDLMIFLCGTIFALKLTRHCQK